MNIPLKMIPPGSNITIQISSDMYVRLQQCLLEGLPYKDFEDFKVQLALVKTSPTEGIGYHMHTLVHLINLIEAGAKDIIQDKEFNTETGKVQ